MENAAYPSSICAERGAIMQAVAAEGPGLQLERIVVVAEMDNNELCYPCGGCRQMLVEFSPQAIVTCRNQKGDEKTMTMDELLPNSFGPHSFKVKSQLDQLNQLD